MPVTVSLLKIVSVPGTRDLWPADFAALVKKLEAKPTDKAAFGVTADWLDENGEPELARAFRYFSRKKEARLHKSSWPEPGGSWDCVGLPDVLSDAALPDDLKTDDTTLPGAMATLYHQIAAAEAEYLKLKEELG